MVDKSNKTSVESLVLGIISVISSIFLFLLVPGKSFGFNIIEPVDAIEEFNKFTFILFLILLLAVVTIGTSIVAIVFGIKDFIGIFRGAYITRGRAIYLFGAALGVLGIISFTLFAITLFLL